MSESMEQSMVKGRMMADGHWPAGAVASDEYSVNGKEEGGEKGWWRTWMGEQIPIMVNLLLMVWWQGGFSAATAWTKHVDIWAGAAVTLLGWKAMSIATRQQEANREVGITDHRIECWKASERIGIAVQALSLFRGIAFSPTPFHLLHAIAVAAYRPYRKWYVARRARLRAETQWRAVYDAGKTHQGSLEDFAKQTLDGCLVLPDLDHRDVSTVVGGPGSDNGSAASTTVEDEMAVGSRVIEEARARMGREKGGEVES